MEMEAPAAEETPARAEERRAAAAAPGKRQAVAAAVKAAPAATAATSSSAPAAPVAVEQRTTEHAVGPTRAGVGIVAAVQRRPRGAGPGRSVARVAKPPKRVEAARGEQARARRILSALAAARQA